MENLYLVVDHSGAIHKPENFINSNECVAEFKMLVKREALGEKAEIKDKNPEYLSYAKSLGFSWEPAAGIGFVQYDHKAQIIMRLVQMYARELVNQVGLPIYEVKGSNFFDLDYPVVQAYAGLFGDRLFKQKVGNKEMVMSYDASYPQFNLASRADIRDNAMPFAHFSISDCYRHEQSGECMLLFRSRRFFMPDIHPYLRDINEAFEWYSRLEQKLIESAEVGHRNYWNLIKVSSQNNWEKYQREIISIVKSRNQPALVEIRRDKVDRYWVIDVDYSIIDSLDQVREIGCIQLDVGNAKRLGIQYLDKDGVARHPVIIHSAIPGGIERYIYMLLDRFKESFPLWLYPVQVRLIPVGESSREHVRKFLGQHNNFSLRIEVDDRNESVSKRVALAHKEVVPHHIIFGNKEANDPSHVINRLSSLSEQVKSFPFIPLSWPAWISQQIK